MHKTPTLKYRAQQPKLKSRSSKADVICSNIPKSLPLATYSYLFILQYITPSFARRVIARKADATTHLYRITTDCCIVNVTRLRQAVGARVFLLLCGPISVKHVHTSTEAWPACVSATIPTLTYSNCSCCCCCCCCCINRVDSLWHTRYRYSTTIGPRVQQNVP